MGLNKLPDGLLLRIFAFETGTETPANADNAVRARQRDLKSVCLVCRRWRQLAQPILFEQIFVCGRSSLAMVHKSLTLTTLGQHVRGLHLYGDFGYNSCKPITPATLLGYCLGRVPGLEHLTLSYMSTYPHVNDFVLHRICLLPKLKKLVIPASGEGIGPFGYNYDPSFLLDLPDSLEVLDISGAMGGFLSMLPDICSNLQRTRPHRRAHFDNRTGSSEHLEQRETRLTGLRALAINWDEFRNPQETVTVFGKIADLLSSTLTKFVSNNDVCPVHLMTRFLSALPLLEHLHLGQVELSSVLFDGLKPLSRLRILEFELVKGPGVSDSEGFCRSLACFLCHSPDFHSFNMITNQMALVDASQLTRGLIAATTTHGPISTLQMVELGAWSTHSIEALEHLCNSAPLLKHLGVRAPIGERMRASAAIDKLKKLVVLKLYAGIIPSSLDYSGNESM